MGLGRASLVGDVSEHSRPNGGIHCHRVTQVWLKDIPVSALLSAPVSVSDFTFLYLHRTVPVFFVDTDTMTDARRESTETETV